MDIFSLKKNKIYLIGIKGSGVSALACILKKLGIKVVGSDTKEKFFTDEILKREKIKFYEGFKKENLKKELPVDLIITSSAYISYSNQNPEIELAKKLNIPILTYSQALASIFNQSFGIAICGSHGKSSTTAILGNIFKDAKLDPTVLVGSEVIKWNGNFLISKNFKKKIKFLQNNEDKLKSVNWVIKNLKKLPIFIIEADEYQDAFLNYLPKIILITNIDYDHPDYFKTEKQYKEVFKKFIKNLQKPSILIKFDSIKKLKLFPFPYPGIHWQKNLNLVYQLIKILKINKNIFINSIKNYKGIKRRFEIIKHIKQINNDLKLINTDNINNKYFHKSMLDSYKSAVDIYFIDDYAHHPTEIFAYFKSLKKLYSNYYIFFIFQPHTFTRTHFLFDKFVDVFRNIKKDKKTTLIIFKTFSSAREKKDILKIKNLKKDIDLAKKLNSLFFDKEEKLIEFIENNIKKIKFEKYNNKVKKQIIVTTVGAGNIYKMFEKIKL